MSVKSHTTFGPIDNETWLIIPAAEHGEHLIHGYSVEYKDTSPALSVQLWDDMEPCFEDVLQKFSPPRTYRQFSPPIGMGHGEAAKLYAPPGGPNTVAVLTLQVETTSI